MHADEPSAWYDYLASCPLQCHAFAEKRLFRGFTPIIIRQLPIQIPEVPLHPFGNGNGTALVVDGGIRQVAAEYHTVGGSLRLILLRKAPVRISNPRLSSSLYFLRAQRSLKKASRSKLRSNSSPISVPISFSVRLMKCFTFRSSSLVMSEFWGIMFVY